MKHFQHWHFRTKLFSECQSAAFAVFVVKCRYQLLRCHLITFPVYEESTGTTKNRNPLDGFSLRHNFHNDTTFHWCWNLPVQRIFVSTRNSSSTWFLIEVKDYNFFWTRLLSDVLSVCGKIVYGDSFDELHVRRVWRFVVAVHARCSTKIPQRYLHRGLFLPVRPEEWLPCSKRHKKLDPSTTWKKTSFQRNDKLSSNSWKVILDSSIQEMSHS